MAPQNNLYMVWRATATTRSWSPLCCSPRFPQVTIVSADMRHWQAPVQADILVSELLGSFGDNELSPECLDGAQRFLRPDGISIPQVGLGNARYFVCTSQGPVGGFFLSDSVYILAGRL